MSTIERKARKPGLYEQQISADRDRRAKALQRQVADTQAAYHADKGFTKVPVGFTHAELVWAKQEQACWGANRLVSLFQGNRQRFAEHGDFTSCFRRGI